MPTLLLEFDYLHHSALGVRQTADPNQKEEHQPGYQLSREATNHVLYLNDQTKYLTLDYLDHENLDLDNLTSTCRPLLGLPELPGRGHLRQRTTGTASGPQQSLPALPEPNGLPEPRPLPRQETVAPGQEQGVPEYLRHFEDTRKHTARRVQPDSEATNHQRHLNDRPGHLTQDYQNQPRYLNQTVHQHKNYLQELPGLPELAGLPEPGLLYHDKKRERHNKNKEDTPNHDHLEEHALQKARRRRKSLNLY